MDLNLINFVENYRRNICINCILGRMWIMKKDSGNLRYFS